MNSSLHAVGWGHSVADWGSGMSACCTACPVVCYHRQWMVIQCIAVSLVMAISLHFWDYIVLLHTSLSCIFNTIAITGHFVLLWVHNVYQVVLYVYRPTTCGICCLPLQPLACSIAADTVSLVSSRHCIHGCGTERIAYLWTIFEKR